MDPETGTSVVTRGRILAVAALAAFAWLMLILFGVSTPATAEEGSGTVDSLLGTLTAEVAEVAPLTLVEPLSSAVDQAIVDRAAEPLEPVVASVAEPVVTAVAEQALTDLAEPVVTHAVEPILGQPLVAETVRLVEDILTHSVASPELSFVLNHEPMISAPTMSNAVVAIQQGPAAVAFTSAASDTRAAHVSAAGSHPNPSQPSSPTGPVLAMAPSLTQGTGAPTLLAAMPPSLGQIMVVGSRSAAENLAPPAPPAFDSDISPD